jgi:hypothetical protein
MKGQNGGITIAEAMIEGFKEIERWSVTKQGLVEAVQESYTKAEMNFDSVMRNSIPFLFQ